LTPFQLIDTLRCSRNARMLSGTVLAVLLCVQLAYVMPMVKARSQGAIATLQHGEQERVQAALQFAVLDDIVADADLLSEVLLSIELTRDQERLLVIDPRVPHTAIDAGKGRGQAIDWTLRTSEGTVQVRGWLDLSGPHRAMVVDVLSWSAFALFASLAGALVALLGVHRHFLRPLENLVEALRDSRERSDGQMFEPTDLSRIGDLSPLVIEFNNLIDAQRKAARQVKVKQQYLEFAAHNDPLTHLPNRLRFEETLRDTVREAVSGGLGFAVFLVDLDNFKFFNDQYGHLIGDKMVTEVGNRLKSMMRNIDLIARLDGDEFVVIQKDVKDRATASDIAARLMAVVTTPYEYRGFTLKTAVSVGISCFPLDVHSHQDEEMLGEEIVNNAAVALQEAKSSGKNQAQLFSESMRSRLTARIRLEQDLKLALSDEQFEVWYQPKVNIHTREVTGAEALVRWRHPVNGFISPEIFVPVAEEAGMIIELGEWILRTACRQTHELQQRGYPHLNVAVNISAVQFTDGNLLPMVSRALADTSLEPGYLELEITESAVMHDPEEVILSLHELSRFGMRLAIDDFGTGYSSLAYLKRFPVDTLKIDRAFITDISSDNDDVAIVEAVLGLGKHFNMKVVAEGVEDEEQLQFLRAQGCDLAQGYYISRPMAFEPYAEWLARWPHGVQGGRDRAAPGEGQPGDNVVELETQRRARG